MKKYSKQAIDIKQNAIELELAWLVIYLPKDLKRYKPVEIIQAYLENTNETNISNIRIRKQGDKYQCTKKFYVGSHEETGQNREETIEISKKRFEELLKTTDKIIYKKRYKYPLENGLIAEIDVYEKKLNGLIVVEVEFKSVVILENFQKPEWFGKEVTDSKGIYPPSIVNLTIEEINKINNEYIQKPHNFIK